MIVSLLYTKTHIFVYFSLTVGNLGTLQEERRAVQIKLGSPLTKRVLCSAAELEESDSGEAEF